MDPISAAGIGLGATSLALQVFAGCVKGYQLFVDAKDMPAAYQHVRVRLRIEQTRLLNWGEKIGLVAEKLDAPSHALQLNRNLIVDILLEVQMLFKSCIAIQNRFDLLVPDKSAASRAPKAGEEHFNRRFPKGTNVMLEKTIAFLEKTTEVPRRLQWAMIKRDKFEGLVEKLIGYNGAIEGLLDSTAFEQLQAMQQQTYLAMLQLNSNIVELKELSLAMQLKTEFPDRLNEKTQALPRTDRQSNQPVDPGDLSPLAEFKAQQVQLELKSSRASIDPIPITSIKIDSTGDRYPSADYQGRSVWVEWKQYPLGHDTSLDWNQLIEDRIRKLAVLLGSDKKPAQFNAPNCLGYLNDNDRNRYGFLYKKPPEVPPETPAKSLYDLIQVSQFPPSLTKRISLAHALARSLMYLHSVNWLHKGLRSNTIIFFTPVGQPLSYLSPLMAGFEYARPDLPDEVTEPPPEHSENDIYRHPAVLARTTSRSRKSHDIYSLGIVLVEIAHWKSFDRIMEMPKDMKAARSKAKKIRNLLLDGPYIENTESAMGKIYARAVKRCIIGGQELGIDEGANENDMEVGARMQEIFGDEVVRKLGEISV